MARIVRAAGAVGDLHAFSGPRTGIVFLPGFASVRGGVKGEALLEEGRRGGHPVLRLDYRGHGDSGTPLEDFTVGGGVEDVVAMLRAPEVRRSMTGAVLVGSSIGGWIALLASAQVPELVSGGAPAPRARRRAGAGELPAHHRPPPPQARRWRGSCS